MLIETARRLTEIKNDLVVVGSTALFVRGLVERPPRDLDVNVENFLNFEGFDVSQYESRSVFSSSGRRGFAMSEQSGVKLDIFAEPERPEHETINGVRVISKESAIKYLRFVIPLVDDRNKNKLLYQLNKYYE